MGLRFRRRIRIAPGVSLNVSKSGLGVSAGPRGAKVGIGTRGIHHSIGLPGTGLHYRKDGQGRSQSRDTTRPAQQATLSPGSAKVGITPDGTIEILGDDGRPLPPEAVEAIKKSHAPQVRQALQDIERQWSTFVNRVLSIHQDTPNPRPSLRHTPTPFETLRPKREADQSPGFWGMIWPPYRRRVEKDNGLKQLVWERAEKSWEQKRISHENQEAANASHLAAAQSGDAAAAEQLLERRLQDIDWPRETQASFEISPDGSSVHLDIDLPIVDDMPQQDVRVAARGLKMNINQKSDTQLRKDYVQHVHGVLFRIIGEVYYTLPRVNDITASAFTQRPDPTTGDVRDEYLISLRCDRAEWERTNFSNLAALDIVEAFARFELRRKVTKTGIFTPIEPLDVTSTG